MLASTVAAIPGSKVIYHNTSPSPGRYAAVWLAPYSKGVVEYIGWDWRSYGWPGAKGGSDWTNVLKLALGSSTTRAPLLPRQRKYDTPVCPYMDGKYTCSKDSARDRSVNTLAACQAKCDADNSCNIVLWSSKFKQCYNAPNCVTSGAERNCNLQLYSAINKPVPFGAAVKQPTKRPTKAAQAPTKVVTKRPVVAQPGPTSTRAYKGPTCPFVTTDGKTCNPKTHRDSSIKSLGACKAKCDAQKGCKYVMWSNRFSGIIAPSCLVPLFRHVLIIVVARGGTKIVYYLTLITIVSDSGSKALSN